MITKGRGTSTASPTVAARGAERERAQDLVRQLRRVHGLQLEPDGAGLDERQIGQVVHEVPHPVGVLPDDIEELHALLAVGEALLDEVLDERLDGRQRRAQLVRDVGDELAPHALERLEPRHVEEEDQRARCLLGPGSRQRRDAQLERASRSRQVEQRLADLPTGRKRRLELAEDRRVAHDLGQEAPGGLERGAEELPEGVVRDPDLPVVAEDDHPLLHRADDRLEEPALAPPPIDLVHEPGDEARQRRGQLTRVATAGRHERPASGPLGGCVDRGGQGLDLAIEAAVGEVADRDGEHDPGESEEEREAENLDP
jgi:hypothetical protein